LARTQVATNPISRLLKPDPSRELFRVLADTLDEAVFVFSGDGSKLQAANHAFLLLTGYARSDLDLLVPESLFPGETGTRAWKQLTDPAGPGEHSLREVPIQRHDGAVYLIDVHARAVGTPRQAILVTAVPTLSRIQMEDQERAEHERVATIDHMARLLGAGVQQALPDLLGAASALLCASAIGVYRISPGGPVYIEQGTLPDEFPSTLPGDSVEPYRSLLNWSRGQRPDNLLQKAARAAGLSALQTAPLGDSPAWIGILVAGWRTVEDMPEDAQELMSLAANMCHAGLVMNTRIGMLADLDSNTSLLNAELDDFVDAVSDAVLALDAELHVVRANRAAADMLGYRKGELEGLPIQDVLVGPEDSLATLLDALGHERKAERPRLVVHRRDGVPIPVSLRAIPASPNTRQRLVVVLSDQSERQAIEDQTEMLAQRALLGEVTAIFAHEVRNPINNISTGVQLVASRLGAEHPSYEALERIRKECTRLDQLMSDVLFFARPLEVKIEALDLADLMTRLLTRWQPRFNQAKVECHTTFDPRTPLAAVDARTFEQVVVNLITNALQAMTSGGMLSVTLSPTEANAVKAVELKIADTGPGIPQAVIDRIFDPFFTTKKDGTGLGLAISRRILAAHKGGIQVESYAGAGTVFTIRVPAANGAG
jgi:two-component system sensor histidine kinase AtoS